MTDDMTVERTAAPPQAPLPAECPIGPAVEVVVGRWTTPVLWTLHRFGRLRFVELERRVPGISAKVLTQRLRQLERDGLVERTYHAEVPPRVEYEITALGQTLAPLFAQLTDWGAAHQEAVERARVRYDGRAGPRPNADPIVG